MSGAASASASPSNGRFTAETKIEPRRSEEHTSELQSQSNLVCRLLLEKKKCEPLHQTMRSGWHSSTISRIHARTCGFDDLAWICRNCSARGDGFGSTGGGAATVEVGPF